MSTITKTIAQATVGGLNQILTGSYVIHRVVATGTAGTTMNFYDGINSEMNTVPGSVSYKFERYPHIRNVTTPDCAAISRDYTNTGVGLGNFLVPSGAVALPVIGAATSGAGDQSMEMVTTRGLYAKVMTAGTPTGNEQMTVTIDYDPNISGLPPT